MVLQIGKVPTTEEGRLQSRGLSAKGVDFSGFLLSTCGPRLPTLGPAGITVVSPSSFSPQLSGRMRHPAGFHEPLFAPSGSLHGFSPIPRQVIPRSASRPANPGGEALPSVPVKTTLGETGGPRFAPGGSVITSVVQTELWVADNNNNSSLQHHAVLICMPVCVCVRVCT